MKTGTHSPNVNTRIALSHRVSVPEFGDDGDWVQAGVLCESSRDDFKGVGVCLEAICFHAFERLCVLGEHSRDVDLRCATATNQCTS